MIMDPRLNGFSGSNNGIHLSNQSISILSNSNIVALPQFNFDSNSNSNHSAFIDHNYDNQFHCPPSNQTSSSLTSVSNLSPEEDLPEDCDFSDAVLRYINQILMEEDLEDKTCMLQESLDLQAAEKSFYDVLGQKYPPSPEQNQNNVFQNDDSPDENLSRNSTSYITNSCNSNGYFDDNSFIQTRGGYNSELQGIPTFCVSQSSCSSSNGVISSFDGLVESPSSIIQLPYLHSESQSVWQFRKGFEEGSRFLPTRNELFLNMESIGLSSKEPNAGTTEAIVKVEKNGEAEFSPGGHKGRKNPYKQGEDEEEEERCSKQAALYTESTLPSEMIDLMLLCSTGKGRDHLSLYREAFRNNGSSKNVRQTGQTKKSCGGKNKSKKQSGKKDVVDLRTLLISCAQAVAADDHRNANELLKQVRQHSSPFGDGNQRLAHCFADGLEARLAGIGSQIYKSLVCKRRTAADSLKAYYLYLAACPFRKISNFASNKTIMNVAAKATRLHVIDFGILYGFQWPTLIQRISWRPGGPPKLRITGIEFPQPGFRPAERVEETGHRLAAYAESFKVPFEYNSIAKKWETIQLEELKIDRDEVTIVNCLYRAKNLHDESVSVESPRNIVLDLIRKINPDLYIQGIINGAFNAPFFVTRFREALFHYSALFDMLETIVPREEMQRMLIEKEIFGREALNVIACEGWERVERPETYKQWQIRILRAGFVQLPFGREVVKRATEKVTSDYHKDFVIDEDSRWLLQGWKGRIIYALSSWKPA
ncbi:scarecrow-like protein 9 [Ziziphus jujuba]|uniref:Scarecrow-like protein 9 n=1 Tax=Ziziphus jujuba TaxID=326968 RepID=A0ABM4AC07_ZIZJJ|nr:scarecrow-like protein 9 [Ziziphus jujuba]XP_060674272.1 scarecrow-like protein 9 [Ziziphus jujuba]